MEAEADVPLWAAPSVVLRKGIKGLGHHSPTSFGDPKIETLKSKQTLSPRTSFDRFCHIAQTQRRLALLSGKFSLNV